MNEKENIINLLESLDEAYRDGKLDQIIHYKGSKTMCYLYKYHVYKVMCPYYADEVGLHIDGLCLGSMFGIGELATKIMSNKNRTYFIRAVKKLLNKAPPCPCKC